MLSATASERSRPFSLHDSSRAKRVFLQGASKRLFIVLVRVTVPIVSALRPAPKRFHSQFPGMAGTITLPNFAITVVRESPRYAPILPGRPCCGPAQTRVSPPSTASSPPTEETVLDVEAGTAEFAHPRGRVDDVA